VAAIITATIISAIMVMMIFLKDLFIYLFIFGYKGSSLLPLGIL